MSYPDPYSAPPPSEQMLDMEFDNSSTSNVEGSPQPQTAPATSEPRTMEAIVNTLVRKIADLELQLQASNTPDTATQPVSSKPKKAKLPDEFKGDRTSVNSFLIQLTIYFENRSSEFTNDYDRILFASSFFRDKALSWLRPQLEFYLERLRNPNSVYVPMFDTYESFVRQLRVTFGDINEQATAERELRMLRQTKSVGFYTSEFQRIASILQWDEKALIYAFYAGLKETVKDEIARVGRPDSLNDLIHFATQIDARLFERLREQRFENKQNQPQLTPVRYLPVRTSKPGPTFPEPMDLSASTSRRSKLTSSEREHRIKNNLCLYCGQAGHKVSTCHLLAHKATAAASTNFPEQNFEPTSNEQTNVESSDRTSEEN